MKPFTDTAGRAWEVVVNVGALRRVRDALGVDLMEVAGGDLLARLADDPVLLVDVLYVLCKAQADGRSVTDEDFGRAMAGGVLDEAASALMKELLDFFPSAQRVRALGKLGRLLEAHRKIAAEAAAAAPDEPAPAPRPEGMCPRATHTGPVETRTDGGSSGNSPGPAASTPTG